MGLYFQEEFLYSAQMMSQITPLGKQNEIFTNCCVTDPALHGSGLMVAEFENNFELLFARFYELRALTADICTFL
jgi:hypothetical protein